MSVFERLEARLREAGIGFTVSHHEKVFTSEEAAKIRGVSLASGAKALICKADDKFMMFVMSANLKLATKLVRKQGIKSLRFATKEEVFTMTGLEPGSIPPQGSLFGLETWCDESLSQQEQINFNAGDHGISISMKFADYARNEHPRIGKYAS
jgi:Ala-tRNA(Pro) deacylase